jgi:hypothetical protein
MVYLPPEIWAYIYDYDGTYRNIFKNVLCELKSRCAKNQNIYVMTQLFHSYNRYKNYYLFHNPRDEGTYDYHSLSYIIKKRNYDCHFQV